MMMEEVAVKPRDVMPEGARTLAARYYTDPSLLKAELDGLFGTMWFYAGRSEEAQRAGQYFVRELNRHNIVVTRNATGEIRAFHNVCRHRGSAILSAPVKGQPTLRCPYHNWAYGLDGSLRATPFWDGNKVADPKSMDRASRGLVPIRSGVWMDVVFVNVSGDAPPLESAMAPFAKLSAPYAMERFRLAHYQAGDVPANWKLTIEAAVENYHEEFVHPSLPELLNLQNQ